MKRVFFVFSILSCMSNYITCSSEQSGSLSILGVAVKENHIPGSRSLSPSSTIIDFDQLDEHGNTLLHKAIQDGDVGVIKMLCLSGANPNTENAMKTSSYSFAFWKYQDSPTDINKEILDLMQQYKTHKKS